MCQLLEMLTVYADLPTILPKVQADMLAATTMAEFQAVEARRHKEILALIVAQQRDDSSVHSVSPAFSALQI